ncbi:MAG: hypothetical protein JWR80_2321 [Bradyrhizobium sp.]|nr:hypothetical protein [Bradyrhizobium sp.]
MSVRGLTFRSIAATILLTVFASSARAQSTTAADGQIKQNIIALLQQRSDDLKKIAGFEKDVTAALAASDYLHYRSVLERYDRLENAYATAALDLIAKEGKELASALNEATYPGFPSCLSKAIAPGEKTQKLVTDAIADLRKSRPSDASGVLKKMLDDLGKGQEQNKLSDCLKAPSGPGEPERLVIPGSQIQNINWTSRCLASELPNRDGTTPLTAPTVASLLYDDGIKGPTAFCTGTLIAPNIVLTAAHCFCQTAAKQSGGAFLQTARECSQGYFVRRGQAQAALDSRHHSVYFQHAGIFAIKQVIIHPNFFWTGALPNADIALLVLEKPVLDIAPTPINTIARLPPGREAKAVGYGYYRPIRANGMPADTIEIKQETGLKLQAPVITDVCPSLASRRGMICWTYKLRARGLSLGSTCMGDSGGPLFADHRGQTYLVGITTAGAVTCSPGSRAYDTEIYPFREWIEESLKRHGSVRPAGQAPAVADQNKCMLCTFCNPNLNQTLGGRNISIDSAKARRLRVSVNCTPGASRSSLHLTLAPPKVVAPPCDNATGPTTATSCEVAVKQGQQWEVRVAGADDRQCQIVATTFNN